MSTKENTPRIGIVGLGWIAQVFHLPILTKFNDVEIPCVCDRDKAKARMIAERYKIPRYYTDYYEMLQKEDLTAVDVCTSTDMHKDFAVAALQSKMDVFVEKPIARTYDEAVTISETVKSTRKKLMVGMNHRFRPDTMMLRSFIENKELGKIYYVKTGWLKRPSSENAWLKQKNISGGGVFLDLGIVMLDLALWMSGYPDVERVNASNYSLNENVEETSIVTLNMKNGSTISIEVSWNFHIENELYYCNIYGEKGSGKINPLKIHKEMLNNVVNVTPMKSESTSNLWKKSYETELKHFIGSIKGNLPIISSSDEAVVRMKILDAIYKSASKHKEIILK